MKAVLIIIGDEILSGNTQDVNTGYIAAKLKNIGIPVVQVFTIPDERQQIEKALGTAFQQGDLVITTGGLGPTRDDKTKQAFAEFFHDRLVTDPETLEHLKNLLARRNREYLFDINRGQAEVLSKAIILQNDYGTAPCQMLEQDGKMIFCLPGVPSEVKPLIREKIIPLIQSRLQLNFIITRIVSVVGIPESVLAQKIENWELALPEYISLSYLPVGTRIKLRITARGADEAQLKKELQSQILSLQKIVGENIIATDGDRIQEILRDLLTEKKLTISVAESCTGGGISRLITSVSGSSKYYSGGICTYQTEKKTEILGVPKEIIDQHTVVSEEVACAMSKGCQKLFRTDIAVSTTGVAGPGTDAYDNTVGLVYYSIRIGENEKTYRLFLPELEREEFMDFVSQKVLQQIVESFLIDKTTVS
ncbi:CinA family nicotinamide mononucleotide deamidase-related protein [Weeksellaceae bacterium A-14]